MIWPRSASVSSWGYYAGYSNSFTGITAVRSASASQTASVTDISSSWKNGEGLQNVRLKDPNQIEEDIMNDFAWALEQLRGSKRVQRSGWNGKGMWLVRIANGEWSSSGSGRYDEYPHLPFIMMKTADNCVVPWLASQTDFLATDWQVVEP